ncbi:hypothetical protein [Listeria grayi]|uniref:hypothetical protein n=1 Tax=Listeria grayi TaxID=1641 RepID=UPI0016278D07|nr:hypothetical protein [Listeria grayi]MBC1921957.1 hypothetical protein [Listeria grayi]
MKDRDIVNLVFTGEIEVRSRSSPRLARDFTEAVKAILVENDDLKEQLKEEEDTWR